MPQLAVPFDHPLQRTSTSPPHTRPSASREAASVP